MLDDLVISSLRHDDYLKPASECNWFDVKVIFDPSEKPGNVAEELEEQYNTNIENGDIYGSNEAVRVYGKWIPILLWNTIVIDHTYVERFTLYYDSFTPYLHLVLYDHGNMLQFSDVPGFANVVTLIMLPHADGAYKAIKVSFYIYNIKYKGEYIICDCEYRNFPLEKNHTEQLVFHLSEGCSSDHTSGVSYSGIEGFNVGNNDIVDCPLGPNKHPNTYELLHVIAELTGLGFAATDECASVRDDKHRWLRHERYKDVIPKHVEFGGTDEDNIFDSWIDLYGYITLVNVPWVMSRKITIHNLAIHMEEGMKATDKAFKENRLSELTHRLISNVHNVVVTNMYVESYENMVNNSSIFDRGSDNTYFDINPQGRDDEATNDISTKGIGTIENSIDGRTHPDKYTFQDVRYRGAEMGTVYDSNYPELQQKDIHKKYFERLRAKRIKVKMAHVNFGLLRGTLIGFSWWETDMIKKRDIQLNAANAVTADKSKQNAIDKDELYTTLINEDYSLMNPFVSGIYYIDGMIFEYEESIHTFTQYLILIKKDGMEPSEQIANMNNHETNNKVQDLHKTTF